MTEKLLKRYSLLVDFLGKALGPDYEVTLHDLDPKNSSIVAIANGRVSGRTLGSPLTKTTQEMLARKQYEENERYNLTTIDNAPAVTGLIFFRPTRGMISSAFDANRKHYGIDIAASPNESVLSTLDGTVILATYTADTGYVIQVQHNQNLVSVYKHCGSLLKKMGDTVKAGEAIALVGNTGEKTTGPHLHFEIWNRGRALDPSKYIVF